MIVLACKDVCKSYGIEKIIENISFQIEEGDRVGLVGVNGAGKSTLLKIVANLLPKDEGDIFFAKGLTTSYLSQESTLDSTKSILQELEGVFNYLKEMEQQLRDLEVKMGDKSLDAKKLDDYMEQYSILSEKFQALDGYGYQSKIRGVLKGLGYGEEDYNKVISSLSGGQKTRVALGKILLENPQLLLLDEPTNYLDVHAIEWLEDYLRGYKGTVVIISHDRYFLDQIVNRVFEIEDKKLYDYRGNYTTFIEKKRVIREQQLKDYTLQQREIGRQEEVIRRLLSFGSEKKVKRARSREKMLERLDRVEKPTLDTDKARITFSSRIKSGRDVLMAENLAVDYPGLHLFSNVSFRVHKEDRVGIIGPNGIGKTTLFKVILGKHKPREGSLTIGHNVEIGYYDQELSGLDSNNTVIEEVWDQNPTLTHGEIRNLLASFLFTGDDVFKDIEDLSGGEKSRVSLLKLMKSESNLLLMDEPTNHLDINSKAVLEDSLLNYDGTVVVISHDRYFLNRICTKIIELDKSGCTEYLGNYSYYQEKKKNLAESYGDVEENLKTKTELKEEKRKERQKREDVKKKKTMLIELEKEIETLEAKLLEIDELLCLPENYSNPEKSKDLHRQSEVIKARIAELYQIWEESF